MPVTIPVDPSRPSQIFDIVLAEVRYRMRLTWRERTASWYIDLLDGETEAPILVGRRVAPGFTPWRPKREGMPEGVLYVRGNDGYSRYDLGDSLQLVFYETSELPAAAADLELTITGL